MKNILIIAGFDPSGGAGILTDYNCIKQNGCFPLTVITANTAQNCKKISMIEPVSYLLIREQLNMIIDEFPVHGVKIGMVHNDKNIEIITEFLEKHNLKNIVLDPVLSSTSGGNLLNPQKKEVLYPLMKISDLITPNLYEAEFLSEIDISNLKQMEESGNIILNSGVQNVLIKGGHLSGDPVDLLINQNGKTEFPGKRLHVGKIRGTGCWLSSAITSNLAKGMNLNQAIKTGKEFLNRKLLNTNYPVEKVGIIL
jgi:hydroxymethylpyrimidine/phosphomethylpyrimidine kinase